MFVNDVVCDRDIVSSGNTTRKRLFRNHF